MARTARTPYHAFPQHLWPKQYVRRFRAIQGDGDRFSKVGVKCSKRNTRSWKGLEYSLGAWLGYLQDEHPELLELPVAQPATRATVAGFIRCLRKTNRQITISIYLQRLYLVLREMDRRADLRWLWTASRRIFKSGQPRQHTHVPGPDIYASGLKLINGARQHAYDYGYVSLSAGRMYRKGLELVLGVLLAERRRTLASLSLGKHLIRSGPRWRLQIPDEDRKGNKGVKSSVLPAEVSGWIDEYVEQFRPALPRATQHEGLWAAGSGRAMHANTIYQSIKRTTKDQLGKSVSPHAFRRSLATDAQRRGLDHLAKAQFLLAHDNVATTLDHYAEPKVSVGNALAKALGSFEPLPPPDCETLWAPRQALGSTLLRSPAGRAEVGKMAAQQAD